MGSEMVRRELQGRSAEGDHCPSRCSPAPSGVAGMVPDILGNTRTTVFSLLYYMFSTHRLDRIPICSRSKGQLVPEQKICTHPRIVEERDGA